MFRDPLWLLALLAAPAALLFHWLGTLRRRALTALVGEAATLARLLPPGAARARRLRSGLEAAALGLLALALAGPQWGVELLPSEARTRQVIVAVDTSLSMLAEDAKPSRIEKAKRELSLLLEALRGERVGIVAFAGEAQVVCPLTTDIDAAKQLLLELEPGMIPVPGTAVGGALRAAAQALERYPGVKSVVLLTDGEDHRSDPAGAAKEAAGKGIRVFAVGIGTAEGEPIPLKEQAGGGLSGYKKDLSGKTVVSRLGESSLAAIASETGGAYYRATPGGDEMLEIADAIKRGAAAGAPSLTQQYRNRFQLPLALGFLLLLASFLVPETAVPAARPGARRAAGALAALALALLAAARPARAAGAEGDLRRGNRLYERAQYGPALESYERAGRARPKDRRPLFNAGDALYRLGELDRAGEAFRALAESKAPAAERADAWYNLGNAAFSRNAFPEAAEAYRNSLRLAPGDRDARHNLAVTLRRIKEPPSKQGEGKAPPQPQQGQDKAKPQPDKDRPQSPERPRPQDQLSREDAKRLLQAVGEREKGLKRQLQKRPPQSKPPPTEEDW